VSQVNLLPPELRQRQAIRRQTTMVALVGVALLVLIGFFYFLQTMHLSSAQDELAQQQLANGQLQQQITELQPFADLQADLEGKQQLMQTLFTNEVSWSGALLDVSRMIPDSSYLTSLTGNVSVPTGTLVSAPPAVPGQVPTGLIGSMTFSGVAKETDTIASWLTLLEQVKGWVNPWVNSAQEQGSFTRIYQFDSGLDLTADAATERGQGGGQL
jgi:Tfp pilus assembly protein PilN